MSEKLLRKGRIYDGAVQGTRGVDGEYIPPKVIEPTVEERELADRFERLLTDNFDNTGLAFVIYPAVTVTESSRDEKVAGIQVSIAVDHIASFSALGTDVIHTSASFNKTESIPLPSERTVLTDDEIVEHISSELEKYTSRQSRQ